MPAHAKAGYRNPVREFLAWLIIGLLDLVVLAGRGTRRLWRRSVEVLGDLAYPDHHIPVGRLAVLVLVVAVIGLSLALAVDL